MPKRTKYVAGALVRSRAPAPGEPVRIVLADGGLMVDTGGSVALIEETGKHYRYGGIMEYTLLHLPGGERSLWDYPDLRRCWTVVETPDDK